MLIISQLLPIASSIAIGSFKAGDLIQLLGISGAAIGLGLLDILQNLLGGILILFAAPAFRFICGVNLKGDYFAQQYSTPS
ncbi:MULTISPECIES: hypothetical protein [unclassified Microcoleus]|uniref:hypothetical protein n=1 Tax=unclassified Microcoleus TaxID=2642155 RepID=UPI002FD3350F